MEAALRLVFNRFPEAGGFGHKIGQNGEVLGGLVVSIEEARRGRVAICSTGKFSL